MLCNCTEEAVRMLLPDVLREYAQKNPGTCTCERCRDDIMALALNSLPPHYVVTDKGSILTKVNFERIGGRAEVIAALIKAIKIVKENPRH